MSVLENIKKPEDIQNLNNKELANLSQEVRKKITDVTFTNGGHLSSNLGIVEATVALYKTFNFTQDKLIFDVGHQCYAHKILSGRNELFSSLRTSSGLSGFPNTEESKYDLFTSGHSGTSIADGIGLCIARDKLKEDFCVIDVVGDGSIVNGLNLEAITSSTTKPKNLIVILNDNGMSISKNINGFYQFIFKSTINKRYVRSKRRIKKIFGDSFLTNFLSSVKNFIKRIFGGVNFFEQYGFKYVGITDGNDLKELCSTLKKVKIAAKEKAVFLHINTIKGKGNLEAEFDSEKYHGVGKQNCDNGICFGEKIAIYLNKKVEQDNNIVAITAGMKDGTGLIEFEKKHKNNFYDVGIAEELAVTLASGMAKGGLKPIIFIYSTFLQRAYDEIIHDVCLQNLPIIFCIDRAGLVGEDGKTHQGVFDLSYLSHIPNLTILSLNSINEIESAFDYALSLKMPVAIRYPKSFNPEKNLNLSDFNEGNWSLLEGDGKAKTVILALGCRMISLASSYRKMLREKADLFEVKKIKPLDNNLLETFKGKKIITLEENALIGGFGSMISSYFSNCPSTKIQNFGVPDKFIAHGTIEEQLVACGLSKELIYEAQKH